MEATKLVERVSFRDSDHTYHLEGKRIPSVTGILGNLSKPALPWWAAKTGAEAIVELLTDRVQQWPQGDSEHMASGAFVAVEEFPTVFDTVQRAHINIRNKAGAKGTTVHGAIEQFHNEFFTMEPPDDPIQRQAFDAFTAWWAEAGLSVVETERKIVDPGGRYAGRLDLVARDADGGLHICDVKTSNGVYVEAVMQNAAYAAAYEAEGAVDGTDENLNQIVGTKVLWLPEGCTKLTVIERDREEWLLDYSIFDSLIDVHRYRVGMDAWMKEVNAANKPVVEVAE